MAALRVAEARLIASPRSDFGGSSVYIIPILPDPATKYLPGP
jgi:hypothetical protein